MRPLAGPPPGGDVAEDIAGLQCLQPSDGNLTGSQTDLAGRCPMPVGAGRFSAERRPRGRGGASRNRQRRLLTHCPLRVAEHVKTYSMGGLRPALTGHRRHSHGWLCQSSRSRVPPPTHTPGPPYQVTLLDTAMSKHALDCVRISAPPSRRDTSTAGIGGRHTRRTIGSSLP